jgi:hypothetical protein
LSDGRVTASKTNEIKAGAFMASTAGLRKPQTFPDVSTMQKEIHHGTLELTQGDLTTLNVNAIVDLSRHLPLVKSMGVTP